MQGLSFRSTAKSLQRFLPPWVKRPAAFAGQVLGYDHAYPSVPASLRTLASWGYRPEFVVDVGAYVGTWTTMFRQCLGDTNVLMIEPQDSKREQLTALCDESPQSTRYASELLAAAPDLEVDFFEMETGSSVLSEMTPWERTTVRKHTSTLDEVVNDNGDWGRPDFVKLDVQGYELEVLKGGSDTVRDAAFVLMEVAFAPYNEGAPLAAEVIRYMDEADYTLLDFSSQIRRTDGLLVHADLLFMNRASSYVSRWAHVEL